MPSRALCPIKWGSGSYPGMRKVNSLLRSLRLLEEPEGHTQGILTLGAGEAWALSGV